MGYEFSKRTNNGNGNLKVVLDIDDEQFEKNWYRYVYEKYINH